MFFFHVLYHSYLVDECAHSRGCEDVYHYVVDDCANSGGCEDVYHYVVDDCANSGGCEDVYHYVADDCANSGGCEGMCLPQPLGDIVEATCTCNVGFTVVGTHCRTCKLIQGHSFYDV